MISHVSLGVRDLTVSGAFYDAVLAPLGVVQVWGDDRALGYGRPGGPDRLALFLQPDTHAAGPGFHLALAAPGIAAVQHSHDAALRHGGVCEGPPGPRPRYGAGYYAAFVRDPDGHKLELKVHPGG